MKKTFLLFPIMFLMFIVNCNGQPKTNYEIYSTLVTNATNYVFFLEKKSNVAYKLIQGMDYLAPDISPLKVGTAATPSLNVNLVNDGSEYTVGIVAVNAAGFYSGLGIAISIVGSVPPAPSNIGLRKK